SRILLSGTRGPDPLPRLRLTGGLGPVATAGVVPVNVSRFLITSLLVCAGVAVVAQPGSRPWPPPIVPFRPDAPALSAEDSMRTLVLPPGYRVELVAAEPLIQDPIVTEFDAEGRLWVIEMPGFMPELNPSNERERQPDGRVVILEDTDDDGRMDTR